MSSVTGAAFGELFLAHPDLFPARRAGDPWGSEAVMVDLAGGPYRFAGLCESQAQTLRRRFADLQVDPSSRDDAVEIGIFRADPRELLDVELNGWEYTFDRDYLPTAVRVAGLRFLGRIDWLPPVAHPRLVGTLWTPEVADGELGRSFFQSQIENFFRLVVAYRLLEAGGALLHSAGIAIGDPNDEVGHLFFGHSGAGKTTISRLALDAGHTVLSDDMNAIAPGADGRPWIERLPFAGDLCRTPSPRRRYPLASLCRLRQGANAIDRLSSAHAIARLVACAPFVNVDPHRVERLTNNLETLARTVGVHRLTFRKDGSFWPLIDGLAPATDET
ncbi:MAG: hypothetical protein AAGE94_14615 [Acidobacteriota bacterium]